MLTLQCRLCSSASALISLSGGKCRKNRDYIRKLVEITIGVKFKKHDLFKYICYPCTVQVYNFYIFKIRSLENEETLEARVKKDDGIKPNKIEISELSSIALPEIEELGNTLVPWLLSKSKYCQSSSESNQDENKEKYSEHIGIRDVSKGGRNESINATGLDMSIQCNLAKNTTDKSTQIDLSSTTCNKYTQYTTANIAAYTQTNGILTKSTEIQCYLLKDNRKKPKLKRVDRAVQCCGTCDICTEIDCKCYVHNLVNIKQEPQLATSIDLSPVNSLILSSKKTMSPIPIASTPIDKIHSTKLNISESGITCRMCHKTLSSKESYREHKKNHMQCSFCKKKFQSMKRSKHHIENDCKIKKKIDAPTVVQLVKVENQKETQISYSKCLENLKSLEMRENKTHLLMRMRSRSTSSVDSFSSCYSFCRNCPVTFLHGLKMGVDKAIQTNFFESSSLLSRDIPVKLKPRKIENLMSPAKKIKLSSSLIQ